MGGNSNRWRRLAPVSPGEWDETRRRLVEEMLGLGMTPAEVEADAERKVRLARLRLEWGRERLAAFFEMQERAGEAYERQIDDYPDVDWESDEAPDLPDPPEEAIAQAIYAEVMAAIEFDRWPRHLHERCV